MKKCVNCGASGIFLKLSDYNLCKECDNEIVPEIKKYGTHFMDYYASLDDTYYKYEKRLKIEYCIEQLNALLQFDKKGIPTIDPSPKELLIDLVAELENLQPPNIEVIKSLSNKLEHDDKIDFNNDLRINDIHLFGIFKFHKEKEQFIQIIGEDLDGYENSQLCAYRALQFISDDRMKYFEYYHDNKLRKETDFLLKDQDQIVIDGSDKQYYYGRNDNEEIYYCLQSVNHYKRGNFDGKQQIFATNGKLRTESWYEDNVRILEKDFDIDNGNLIEELHPEFGKKYYPDGKLKAEWKSIEFQIIGQYTEYHPNGNIKMVVNYNDAGNRDGEMKKYFLNNSIKEKWVYSDGTRRYIEKYNQDGSIKSKWYYDENGKEANKVKL